MKLRQVSRALSKGSRVIFITFWDSPKRPTFPGIEVKGGSHCEKIFFRFFLFCIFLMLGVSRLYLHNFKVDLEKFWEIWKVLYRQRSAQNQVHAQVTWCQSPEIFMSKNPNVSNKRDYELTYCLELGRESLAMTRPYTAAIFELQKITSVKTLNAIISKLHFSNWAH